MSVGVVAIFGPFTPETIGIVESVCSKLRVPHFILQWIPEDFRYNSERPNDMTYNLFPDSNWLATAFRDIIVDNDWQGYNIFYDSEEGLMRLKEIIQAHEPMDNPIVVRELADDYEYRPLLKEIKTSGTGIWDIVLDCSDDKIIQIIKNAHELNMLKKYNRFFITSLDTHTLSFKGTEAGNGNITSVRLFDVNNTEITHYMSSVGHQFNLTTDVSIVLSCEFS